MKRPGVMLAAALLAAAPAVAQQSLERRIALDPDASIRVLNLVGSVRVTGWEWDSLVMKGRLEPGAGKVYFGGGGKGAKLGVESLDGEPAGRSDLELRVPRRAKLWIKGATADIEITGFDGTLDLYSVSGAIRVDGRPAQVYAESMDGNVEVTGAAPWIRVKTASGAIALRGGGEDVAATTVSGAITLEGARLVRGRFESVTGDIRFTGDVDRGASLSFESHSGVIELRLPATVAADFTVNGFQSDIVNELTRDRARPIRDRGGMGLSFSVGQGGADVSIRSFKGPVILRTQK